LVTADINDGTIDGTVIGGNSAEAGAFTTITGSSDMNIDSGTLFVDSANNRVGVGTSSPSEKFEVLGRGKFDFLEVDNIEINGSSVETKSGNLALSSGEDAGGKLDLSAKDAIRFNVNGSEAARIDSSGNLLVGTTTLNPSITATPGVNIFPLGLFNASRDDGKSLDLGRNNSDGEIVRFRKDGSTVGSIGAINGNMFLGTGDTNLRFNPAANLIAPVGANAATKDGQIDLGNSSNRFDDIFATNGTIQTSDVNEKQDIDVLSDAETRVAAKAKTPAGSLPLKKKATRLVFTSELSHRTWNRHLSTKVWMLVGTACSFAASGTRPR
jgi:hypothetical protein